MGLLISAESKTTQADADDEYVVIEDEIIPTLAVEQEHIRIDDDRSRDELGGYCIRLFNFTFCGQTNNVENADEASITDVLNLGLYLSLLDKFLRQFKNVTEFTGEEEEYQQLLRLVAMKRRSIKESGDVCHQRLLNDSKRFVQLYHKRGVISEKLEHGVYWGSRQQLLSAKVISDWIDTDSGPMDPLFGVLLNPTGGRVGPGDTGWFHNILFDDNGYMAYHSAVHDAFGYLITFHHTGPGYNYMYDSFLANDNPLAGQLSGIQFWKKVVTQIETKQKVIKYTSL